MKTRINKLFILIIATILITLATACDSSTLRKSQEDSGTETFIINGTISLNADAMPKEFINTKQNLGRAATSSFKPTGDKYSYSVIAVQGQKTLTATISKSDDSVYYTLYLNSRGTWIIKASLYYEDELVAQAEDEEVIISEGIANGSSVSGSKWLTVTPQIDASKKGAISLAIKNQVSDTSSITWHWVGTVQNGNTILEDKTKTVSSSNELAEFVYESVNSGSYNVEIIFKDSEEKVIYSCYEAINVFANWTTDAWCGKSPYLNDKNEFVFDDTVKAAFGQSMADIENTAEAPLFLLWSDSPSEKTKTETIETTTATNSVGAQVFNSVTEGMTITNPLNCGANYCFDGTTLYVPPYRYKPSYAGYAKDSSFDLAEMIGGPNLFFPSDTNCVFLDGFIYFVYGVDQGGMPFYQIVRYNTQDESLLPALEMLTSENYNITAIAVTHYCDPVTQETDPSSGVLYIATEEFGLESTTKKLYRKPFVVQYDSYIEYDAITFTTGLTVGENTIEPASININTATTTRVPDDLLTIKDMTIIDDSLYALVASEGLAARAEQVLYTKNAQGAYEATDIYGFISNGGIMKFDVSLAAAGESSFIPLSWGENIDTNTNNRILGMYTLPNDTDYYANKQSSENDTLAYQQLNGKRFSTMTYSYAFPVQAPLEQANKYFYGPRKILATKANQLIIADDGGYFEATGHAGQFSKNWNPIKQIPMNRIVTVDLDEPAITSIVDVGVTFSAMHGGDSNPYYTTLSPMVGP